MRFSSWHPVGWGFESLRAHICEGIGVMARTGSRLTAVVTAVLPRSGFAILSGPVNSAVLADSQAAWDSWTMPQRRAAVSALFDSITVTHLERAQGPTVDRSRVKFRWKHGGHAGSTHV